MPEPRPPTPMHPTPNRSLGDWPPSAYRLTQTCGTPRPTATPNPLPAEITERLRKSRREDFEDFAVLMAGSSSVATRNKGWTSLAVTAAVRQKGCCYLCGEFSAGLQQAAALLATIATARPQTGQQHVDTAFVYDMTIPYSNSQPKCTSPERALYQWCVGGFNTAEAKLP